MLERISPHAGRSSKMADLSKPKHAKIVAAIRDRYPQEGPDSLAREFGRARSTIMIYASALGVKSATRCERQGQAMMRRCRNVNTNYFDSWSPNMAYILGYIWADGCVTKAQSGELSLCFCLTETDVSLLYSILREMGATAKVSHRAEYVHPEGKYKSKRAALAKVNNTNLVRKLMNDHGIPLRKSYTDPDFPYVPDDMMPHFARGNFDGDGCVTFTKTKRSSKGAATWLGTPTFVRGMQQAISRLAGVPQNQEVFSGNVLHVQWAAKADLVRLHRWLYQDTQALSLARKKAKWDEMLVEFGPEEAWFCNRLSDWPIERLDQLYKSVGSWKKVATAAGIPPGTIHSLVKRLRARSLTASSSPAASSGSAPCG